MINKNQVFARIVAARTGYVYVILKNFQCCAFSTACLSSLLHDPTLFIRSESKKYLSLEGYPAPLKGNLMDIPGLTLAVLTDERQFICEYPEIICLALLHSKQHTEDVHINIGDIFGDGPILDQKQWCIEVYLAMGNKKTGELQNHNFSLSDNTQAQIFAEILHSRFYNHPHQPYCQDKSASTAAESPLVEVSHATTTDAPTLEDSAEQFRDVDILPFSLCNPPHPEGNTFKSKKNIRENNTDGIPKSYVTLPDYSRLHNVSGTTIHQWIKKGWIAPLKDGRGHWWLDPKDTPEKIQQRNSRRKKKNGHAKRLAGNSYMDVQRYVHITINGTPCQACRLVVDQVPGVISQCIFNRMDSRTGFHFCIMLPQDLSGFLL